MSEKSKKAAEQRQDFLMTFFDHYHNGKEENAVKNVNGFVLFKHWDGNLKKWRVDIFTEQSFKNMTDFSKKHERRRI